MDFYLLLVFLLQYFDTCFALGILSHTSNIPRRRHVLLVYDTSTDFTSKELFKSKPRRKRLKVSILRTLCLCDILHLCKYVFRKFTSTDQLTFDFIPSTHMDSSDCTQLLLFTQKSSLDDLFWWSLISFCLWDPVCKSLSWQCLKK
jgi:hypothetical protein